MSDKSSDEVKGRVKEAVGALTGDEDMKNEGRIDQATADLKERAENAIDGVKNFVTGKKQDRDD